MTDTPVELHLTPDAEARLEDYLRQVRATLAGIADVNPEEIEADVREHVGNELHEVPRPVGVAALEAVLTRLGPPDQWATGERPSGLRRVGHLIRERLRHAGEATRDRLRAVGEAARGRLRGAREVLLRGPEDRRLAYLSFGVFAIGVLTVVLFPLALVVSYLLSRAGIALAREKAIPLDGGRKWLLYPPVVIVGVALLVGVVFGPPVVGLVAGSHAVEDADRRERWELAGKPVTITSPRALRHQHPDVVTTLDRVLAQFPGNREVERMLAVAFAGVGVFALWGLILGALGATFPGLVRGVFCPLCAGHRRGRGVWLAVVSLLVLVIWGVAAFEIAANAGLVRTPGG
jgi:hypothetical protein